ncbi:MAG TPA: TlpA disulfide reductase family protein [Acidimicrobiales bacterium]|nr:TlpA disulfide reductase family protein [Acidimicrobiales bacterium]
MTVTSPEPPTESPTRRKPRKVFLLVGLVLALGLGVGLFTSVGTSKNSGAPHKGSAVPSFTGENLNGSGSVTVSAAASGTPTVLLFFGKWCPQCHAELPPLAASVRQAKSNGGALSALRVVGVDSEDTVANAKSFIASSGVTFTVAYDPNLDITSGDFYFEGDPFAVFVNGNGTINAIVRGPMSVAAFTAHERAITPSGS